jgi:hypothetical protein
MNIKVEEVMELEDKLHEKINFMMKPLAPQLLVCSSSLPKPSQIWKVNQTMSSSALWMLTTTILRMNISKGGTPGS